MGFAIPESRKQVFVLAVIRRELSMQIGQFVQALHKESISLVAHEGCFYRKSLQRREQNTGWKPMLH